MINKKLSIILSAYNVENYISKTIDSLANQTSNNFEVIAVDDCSTDDTVKILQDYEEKYDWLRVVCHAQNAGASAARNTGLKLTTSELVTFIDGDDWVEPSYVEYFLDKFSEMPNVDLVSCGFFIDSKNGKSKPQLEKKELGQVSRDEAIKQIIKMNGSVMGYAWNKAYRRSIIEENELKFPTDLTLMEDQLFNVQYATVAENFYLNDKPLYHYVSRKDSITKKFDMENVRDVGVATMKVYKTIHQGTKEERQQEET
ncbi:glycosyltransferase family 2 protein [Companilactobacillus ginsenosidimutans]|uniref:Glycosyl transferase n=1 Tax=Companilactobacillus ginsenosidimutans TaxID=1007676 RepID=A0A0H4QLP3_9LACO|nr:glycosyltransferase family 2 protein [Companilactobacillus ginsenosidimutans]AKP68021.1 glycosyl transferase [Companilactobacillus ginsenosidimutans]